MVKLFFRAAWSYMTCDRTAFRTRSSRNWLGSVELSQRRPGWEGGGRGLRFLFLGGFLAGFCSASGLPTGLWVSVEGADSGGYGGDALEERAAGGSGWAATGGRGAGGWSASIFAAEPLLSSIRDTQGM